MLAKRMKIWEDCPIQTPLNETGHKCRSERERKQAWLFMVNSGAASKVPFGDAEREFFAWASERCAGVSVTPNRQNEKRENTATARWAISRALASVPRKEWLWFFERGFADAEDLLRPV